MYQSTFDVMKPHIQRLKDFMYFSDSAVETFCGEIAKLCHTKKKEVSSFVVLCSCLSKCGMLWHYFLNFSATNRGNTVLFLTVPNSMRKMRDFNKETITELGWSHLGNDRQITVLNHRPSLFYSVDLSIYSASFNTCKKPCILIHFFFPGLRVRDSLTCSWKVHKYVRRTRVPEEHESLFEQRLCLLQASRDLSQTDIG